VSRSAQVPVLEAGTAVWSSARWREQAVAWMDERLAAAGAARVGEVEQPRVRAWSTLLTAPTTIGRVWLKASREATAFEASLYRILARVSPESVLAPLATDEARGWVLLPDGGPTLALAALDPAAALETILPHYARLQLAAAPHVGELIAAGVEDMRPEAMPPRFGEAVEMARAFVSVRGRPGDAEALERVVALREPFRGWCERLAASPVPHSIDHNDLHERNILVEPAGETLRPRFFDWGDAVVAHPFASMLVTLDSLRQRLRRDDHRVARVRDAYLEVFSDVAPHAELVATLALACRVAKVARALTFARAVAGLGDDGNPALIRGPFEALRSLVDG